MNLHLPAILWTPNMIRIQEFRLKASFASPP